AGFAGRRPVHRRTGQPPGAVVELRALPQRTGAGAGLLPAADGAAAEPRTLHRSGALRAGGAAGLSGAAKVRMAAGTAPTALRVTWPAGRIAPSCTPTGARPWPRPADKNDVVRPNESEPR